MCCNHFILDLEIWWMTLKNIRHLSYATLSLCIKSKPSVNSNLRYSPKTLNSSSNRQFLVPCDLAIWRMTLKNNRAPLLCCFKLCASFHSHQWILTGVTVRKRPIWVIFFFVSCDLKIWWMTLKKYRAHLLSNIKLCSSFHHHHMWFDTGVTVRKGLSWVLTSATLTFDLWPWPFAWASLRSLVVTPKISRRSRMLTVKRVWQSERRTELSIHRAAWSQLKT